MGEIRSFSGWMRLSPVKNGLYISGMSPKKRRSGLGYIVGSETARMTGAWQNGLRVTPVLGKYVQIQSMLL
ncbi:hypothetical protein J6590_037950 [Homalodisca vitripennis]|nr:hypothetical protein J6590_037950 [Homalodisca vitripennis]